MGHFRDLLVLAFDLVSIIEDPLSLAFWLVVIEVTFEVSSVRQNPLALHEISSLPSAKHFHASLKEDESSFSFLESVFPES